MQNNAEWKIIQIENAGSKKGRNPNTQYNKFNKNKRHSTSLYFEKDDSRSNTKSQAHESHIDEQHKDNEKENMAFLVDQPGKHIWVIDKGSSSHVANSKEYSQKIFTNRNQYNSR